MGLAVPRHALMLLLAVFKLFRMNINISPSHFETLSLLGEGTYAKVFLVRHKASQQLMAAKVIKKDLVRKKNVVPYILNEKDILSETSHPFVMQLSCSFHTRSKLYLMMEYCPGGELFKLLQKKGKLNENQYQFLYSEPASTPARSPWLWATSTTGTSSTESKSLIKQSQI